MDYGIPYAYVSSMGMMLLLTYANVIQCLGPALLDIRKMCCQIGETNLFRMEKKHTYTLQEFQDSLFEQQQEVHFCKFMEKNDAMYIYQFYTSLCASLETLIFFTIFRLRVTWRNFKTW